MKKNRKIVLAPQSNDPSFIIKDGKVLVRKMYEVVLIDGEAVMRDLPLSGQQPEYLDDEGVKKWFEENKKALMQGEKEARMKATIESLEKAGIKHVQKTGSILMPLSAEQTKAMKAKRSK